VTWQASLGALLEAEGARFRVWAPEARSIVVLTERAGRPLARAQLQPGDHGLFEAWVPEVRAGDRYRFQLDGEGPFPDPASRFQPDGVHGPSEVVDPGTFEWTDGKWRGVPLESLVLYELHVGTFSPQGTFAGVAAKLPELRDLGVTAIELMPVADFPGMRNWGYDGAALFAPARCYGTPDDLRRLADAAHKHGLAVHLDVVYNHFGPDGAYAAAFSPSFFSARHRSPWGAGINLDGERSEQVRDFFIENALHWIHEYHIDGLRLDATHAMVDGGPRRFLAEFSDRVRAGAGERPVLIIAEDARNLAHAVKPVDAGGWGMDAVWSDDFHHQMRRLLAGDHESYYQDFSGTVADVAATLRRGWFYTGQRSAYHEAPRGTDPSGLPPRRFVFFIQNHDQVGNRAMGERLHHQIDPAAFRAASVVLLMAPQTPLLFMGQEWAARTPFRFFTDHHSDLGRLVTEGRRREFQRFRAFSDPMARLRIPDPQAATTFASSRLVWEERMRGPHAATLRLYRELLARRRSEPALRSESGAAFEAKAVDADTLVLRRRGAGGATLLAVARLRGAGAVELRPPLLDPRDATWTPAWSSEDPAFAEDPQPIRVEATKKQGLRIEFARPSALVLQPA